MTRPGSQEVAAEAEFLIAAQPGVPEAEPGQGVRGAGEGLRRVAEEQAALRRIAVQVARAAPPEEVFAAVTDEVHRLLAPDFTVMCRFNPDSTLTVVGVQVSPGTAFPTNVGDRGSVGGRNVFTLLLQTGRPARMDDMGQDAVPPLSPGTSLEAFARAMAAALAAGVRSAVAVPVNVAGRLWGVMAIAAAHERRLPADTEERLAGFTELVAIAIANAEAQTELTASRARIVATADQTRRRFERDLHDGAQQSLVSLALQVRAARAAPPEGDDLDQWLDRMAAALDDVLEEVREIARGLHPAALAAGGLRPALRALARRSVVPVRLDVQVAGRLPDPVEITAYYAVSEALANTAKHAGASAVDVRVTVADDVLCVRVSDDGRGGADFAGSSGLLGVKDRVEALGGRISLHSPPDAGTTVEITLPLRPGRQVHAH
jgi:signal transduction histidine kinase